MASAGLKDELTCSICLSLYTDPVTLRCGHNFCQKCIKRALDLQEGSGAYTCPQCRAVFRERLVLQKNTTLCNVVEHFLSEAQESEVFCIHCINTPVIASKTCLLCKISMCDHHLMVHNKSPEHVLIQPIKSFNSLICAQHKKVCMYYCLEDAEQLCFTCSFGGKHRGHKVELLNVAFRKKQEKLRIIKGHLIKESEEIEKRVHWLQDHLMQIPEKAAGIVENVCIRFRDLRMKHDDLETHVLNEISNQREKVSRSVSELIQQLKLKKDGLSVKLFTIEELCQMTDPLLYLKADREDFAIVENSDRTLEINVDDLAENLFLKILNSGMENILSDLQKGYYVQEASGILLDVNTASNDVRISCDLKTASWSDVNQRRPKTCERFVIRRVLSMKSFSEGKLYWDIEVSREGGWRVGMTYPSIERKGKYSLIGNNNKSWGLRSFNKQYSVRHNKKEIPLARRPSCYNLRIYLDYTAGLLSFYELHNSMTHLYTYNATFTEALYPVFVVWANAWVKVLS